MIRCETPLGVIRRKDELVAPVPGRGYPDAYR